MKAVPIHQAKAHLSEYIATAKKGTPVYIGSFGNAEVVLTAVPKPVLTPLWGSLRGKLWISDDAWNTADARVAEDFDSALKRDI